MATAKATAAGRLRRRARAHSAAATRTHPIMPSAMVSNRATPFPPPPCGGSLDKSLSSYPPIEVVPPVPACGCPPAPVRRPGQDHRFTRSQLKTCSSAQTHRMRRMLWTNSVGDSWKDMRKITPRHARNSPLSPFRFGSFMVSLPYC